jgi:hypothetical protein
LDDKTKADYKNAAGSKDAAKAVEQANKRYQDNRRDLEKAAIAAGYSKREVKKMIDQYLKTPNRIRTDVSTPGVDTARGKVQDLDRKINNLNSKKVSASVSFSSNARKFYDSIGIRVAGVNSSGGLTIRKDGGPIRGPGTSTSDSILGVHGATGIPMYRFSDGEFMVNARQTARNRRQVEQINAGGEWDLVPRRDGGLVTRRVVVEGRSNDLANRYVNINPVTSRTGLAAASRYLQVFADRFESTLRKKMAAADGGGLGDPAHVSNPRGVTSYRGGRFTRLFVANLKAAERDAGRNFSIYQGGFRPTTSYSGSTHNMDAIDAHVNYSLLRAFRRHVGAMGDRTGLGNWAAHMHGVPAPGHGYGSPSARAQYRDYVRRGGAKQSPRSPWGLDRGGVMVDPSTVNVSERAPERVLSGRQTVAFERLVNGLSRTGGAVTVHQHITINAPNYVGPQRELAQAITTLTNRGALDKVAQQFGKVTSR